MRLKVQDIHRESLQISCKNLVTLSVTINGLMIASLIDSGIWPHTFSIR